MPSSPSALSLSQHQDLWSHNDSQMRDLIIGYQGFYRRIGLRDKGVTLIGMMATWKAKISLPFPLSLLQPSITKTSQFSLWDVLGDYHDIHVPLFYEAFFFFFGRTSWHAESLFPDHKSNLHPLWWKHRALTIGPPGSPWPILLYSSLLSLWGPHRPSFLQSFHSPLRVPGPILLLISKHSASTLTQSKWKCLGLGVWKFKLA